jgi:hypothetical protein
MVKSEGKGALEAYFGITNNCSQGKFVEKEGHDRYHCIPHDTLLSMAIIHSNKKR